MSKIVMSDYLEKLDRQINNITEEIVDELNNEDWSIYDSDDLCEIMTRLYGRNHPLVEEYNELSNKITKEVQRLT